MAKKEVEEILKKYGAQIESQITTAPEAIREAGEVSSEYGQFKKEMIPQATRYENYCRALGEIIHVNLAEKDRVKIQRQIDIAHLDITPSHVIGMSIVAVFLVFFLSALASVGYLLITGSFPVLIFFLLMMFSLFLFYYLYQMPFRMANRWRLKASSQMVPAVLYIVVYMKHTSNLERAVGFASQHLQAPLALDFKKIFWDVETGKYSTVKASLDAYLETWRDYSPEFIESFHLIESSLFEPSEERRVEILERALTNILDGVYDKMLKFSHAIRSPLTNLYMLGIVLPTLGLALLPLAAALLQGAIKFYHVFLLFNLVIPLFVYYLTTEILLKRPGGYGEAELLEANPEYHKFKSKKPYYTAALICLPLLIIGLLPLIFQYTPVPELLGMQKDYSLAYFGIEMFGEMQLFHFVEKGEGMAGPFSPIALLIGLLVPLSIALFFAIANKARTKDLIKARDDTKDLEKEFVASLFQLGNRIGGGTPAEIAFGNVAEAAQGLKTENFFRIVSSNIQQMGMSLEGAIFDKRRGALIYYPSMLIATSMKILVESLRKGLGVAARSLMAISEYVKNIEKINQRLTDLLAEVVSDMKSNMTFLAPLLAGIVVGLAGMIATIFAKLEALLALGAGGQNVLGGAFSIEQITSLFRLENTIPPYFLQISIGIYLIEIMFILTTTLVTVDAGEDKLQTVNKIGSNLRTGMLMYVMVAMIAILVLSLLASIALSGFAGG